MLPDVATVERILRREGGWSDHPDDRGGMTNYGITLATLKSLDPNATPDVLRNLTKEEASGILLQVYWVETGFSRLWVSEPLAELLLDTAVHSGGPNAVRMLQRAVSVDSDGIIGPITEEAVKRLNGPHLMALVVSERMLWLANLVSMDPSQGVFLRGWTRRLREFVLEIPFS